MSKKNNKNGEENVTQFNQIDVNQFDYISFDTNFCITNKRYKEKKEPIFKGFVHPDINFFEQIKNSNKFILSQIVYEEILKNYNEQWKPKIKKIRESLDFLINFGIISKEALIELQNQYKELVDKNVFKKQLDQYIDDTNCTMIGYEYIHSKDLFTSYFEQKIPFANGEKEFLDAGILYSLESFAKQKNKKILFLTNDKDYNNFESNHIVISKNVEWKNIRKQILPKIIEVSSYGSLKYNGTCFPTIINGSKQNQLSLIGKILKKLFVNNIESIKNEIISQYPFEFDVNCLVNSKYYHEIEINDFELMSLQNGKDIELGVISSDEFIDVEVFVNFDTKIKVAIDISYYDNENDSYLLGKKTKIEEFSVNVRYKLIYEGDFKQLLSIVNIDKLLSDNNLNSEMQEADIESFFKKNNLDLLLKEVNIKDVICKNIDLLEKIQCDFGEVEFYYD